MKLLVLSATVLLAACAASSSSVPIGRDTYMISKQAATGFSGLGNLKAEALGEANGKCSSMGKSMELIGATESKPPYILGNYPRVEIQFSCR